MSALQLQGPPALVKKAMLLVETHQFKQSSIMEVGRLLSVLAAQVQDGLLGEIGSGCGFGTAWLVSGMSALARLLTVEIDEVRAAAVRSLFQGDSRVEVVTGDWRRLRHTKKFDLLFADGGIDAQNSERLIEWLSIGGLLIKDDLTPQEYWPDDWRGKKDPVREFWMTNPRLRATEVRVADRHAVILAARVG